MSSSPAKKRFPDPLERRQEPREAVDEPAEVQVLRPLLQGKAKRIHVRILEVSPSGIKLRSPVSIEIGVEIQIRTRRSYIMAEVRHSTRREEGFHIGAIILAIHPTR